MGARFLSAIALSLASGCGASDVSEDAEKTVAAVEIADLTGADILLGDDAPYRHPLSGLEARAGEVPALDRKDSERGNRYGVVDRARATAGGVEQRYSGLVELEREPIIDVGPRKHVPLLDERRPATVETALEQIIAKAPSQPLQVVLNLKRPHLLSMTSELERAIAVGRIRTRGDYESFKRGFRIGREAQVEGAQLPVIAALEQLGGKVIYQCRNLYCLTVEIAGEKLHELLKQAPSIARAELPEIFHTEGVDGKHVADGSQMTPGLQTGQNGNIINGAEIIQYEPGLPSITNAAWNDLAHTASPNPRRILERWDCSTNPCTQVGSGNTSFDSGHATLVAGLMIGDLTNDQDANVTNSTDQLRRSGYAREAALVSVQTGTAGADFILDRSPRAVNMSGGSTIECLGQTNSSKNVNAMFEDGIAFFKSAGNEGNAGGTCSVTAPAAAIGAFTVGNHRGSYQGAGDGEAEVRDAAIAGSSSRGGTSTEGGGRTIVDITAFGGRTLLMDTGGTYTGATSGTSLSSPTVAAAAINFSDWYINTQSNLIDNPGILFANLLLMGDRQGEGGFLTTGFDGLWGAGRLQARQFLNATMDAPWEWATGWTCIDDNEQYSYSVNDGELLPNDVSYLKAALWWYDRRHEDGGDVDNIGLSVQRSASGSSTWANVSGASSDADADENKEFVFLPATSSTIDGYKVRLTIKGTEVTADDEGCGTNSMKVYWAYFFEDRDRDDAGKPYLSAIDREDEH